MSVMKFFFHWHYSPLWALACRTMSLHFFLSATNSLHLLTPSTWRSLSTSSFLLFVGLPHLLVPSSPWVKIFWASYPPPFSLGDITSLSFALSSILLYFLLCCYEIGVNKILKVAKVSFICTHQQWRTEVINRVQYGTFLYNSETCEFRSYGTYLRGGNWKCA